MTRRVTVILDDSLMKKLRKKQAELIKESSNSVSFSGVINQVLRKNFKEI